ncbi:MAG: ECF transporter S component [Ignavibacteriales bacterium]|nr:ECF transporter S component [Ignavibacteriales bacterium]
MKLSEQFTKETSGAAIPFIAFCIALNLTVGQVTSALKIPIYLDSIGTVLTAVLVGPLAAATAGALSNLLASAMGSPTMAFFVPVSLVIGLFSGTLARRGWFKQWYLVVLGGALQGVLAAVCSAPISAYLFSGVMMAGTDFLVLYFRSVGNTIMESVFYQGLASDPVDKIITYLIVFLLMRNLPRRLTGRFAGAANIPSRSA